jgi:hypothetical protein
MRLRMLWVLCAAAVALIVGVGIATAGGGNSTNAKKCQKGGWQQVYRTNGTGFASQDECVAYAAKGGVVTSARLVITTDVLFECAAGSCWGVLTGSGLAANAPISIFAATGLTGGTVADADGNIDLVPLFSCGSGYTGVYATSTAADGATITSNTVNTPCG